MAINFYSSISLNKNELQNAVVQNAGSDPGSPAAGQIYYNSGDNTLRFYNGTAFQTVNVTGADITSVQDGNGLTGGANSGDVTLAVGAGNGITVNTNDVAVTAAQTTITSVLNASLAVGRDADNQIKFGTDNQMIFRVGAGDNVIFKASGEIEATSLDISGDADIDGTLEADAFTVNGTALNEFIQDTVGAMFSSNTETRISATYQDGDGTIDLVVDDMTANDNDDVSVANLKTRLAGGFGSNAVTIGDSNDVVTIGNDLIITGDLTVSGDTITANVGTLNVEDKNITLNQGSGDTSSTADGAGITIQDAVDASNDATLLWNAANDKFVFSHLIEAPGTSIFASLDISGDVDVDGTLETDALTINGTSLADTIAGTTVTNATNSAHVLVTDNESTNEENAITFVEGGTKNSSGNVGLESDGTLTYNPSTGTVTATIFKGNIDAVDGDFDGTLEADALTIGGAEILAQATTSAVGAVELATSAETQTGTSTTRAVTPDGLAARHVVADIDVSSLTDANIVTITHNLGTADIMVQVYDKTTEANIMCDIARTTDDFATASTSVVSIDFGTAPPNDCRALITSLKGATASGTVAYT